MMSRERKYGIYDTSYGNSFTTATSLRLFTTNVQTEDINICCLVLLEHLSLKIETQELNIFKRQKHISDKGDFLLWSSNNASKEVWVSGKGGRLDKSKQKPDPKPEKMVIFVQCRLCHIFPPPQPLKYSGLNFQDLFFECMMQTLSIYVHAGSLIWQSSAGNNIS